MNRIAYITSEGGLVTINPDGSDAQVITGGIRPIGATEDSPVQFLETGRFYTWPTWSPDGTKLAVSCIQRSSDLSRVSIQVIDVTTGRATLLYENDLSVFFPVTQTAPHYLYWAPDSKSLAFVASTFQRLTLFVQNTETEDTPTVVQTGAPIYFHWAGDSNSILLHIREDLKLAQKPFDADSRELLTSVDGFRVPALSPDGRLMAYTSVSEAGGSLFIAETGDLSTARSVLEVGPWSAFMWSPDGTELAVADRTDPAESILQRLRVVSRDGSTVQTIADEPLISFHWSPNGQRIAWVALKLDANVYEWNASSRTGAPARQLFRFEPTPEAFELMFWFDQFAYSQSPWSPDSSQLVVTGTQEQSSPEDDEQTPTEPQVYVLDADGDTEPRQIASGIMALWSWN